MTKEKLNELKEKVEELQEELRELTPEELEQVFGGGVAIFGLASSNMAQKLPRYSVTKSTPEL